MINETDINLLAIFKPGNTVFLSLGNEVLNSHIDWRETLLQTMLYKDCGLKQIANDVSCSEAALRLILNRNDASLLNFKQGTRLLSLHDATLPDNVWLTVNAK